MKICNGGRVNTSGKATMGAIDIAGGRFLFAFYPPDRCGVCYNELGCHCIYSPCNSGINSPDFAHNFYFNVFYLVQ